MKPKLFGPTPVIGKIGYNMNKIKLEQIDWHCVTGHIVLLVQILANLAILRQDYKLKLNLFYCILLGCDRRFASILYAVESTARLRISIKEVEKKLVG